MLEECAQRTEILSQQLRKAEEERVREDTKSCTKSEEKVQLIHSKYSLLNYNICKLLYFYYYYLLFLIQIILNFIEDNSL